MENTTTSAATRQQAIIARQFDFLRNADPRAFYKSDLLEYAKEIGLTLPAGWTKGKLLSQLQHQIKQWAPLCKTCGSEIVETVNDSNFNDGECGPCEYERYKSRPANPVRKTTPEAPTAMAPSFIGPPYFADASECDGVYGGEKHYAVLADNERGVVADVEGGLTPEAKANADFIVRACNTHAELVTSLEGLIQATEFLTANWEHNLSEAVSDLSRAAEEAKSVLVHANAKAS
jgi:hypothetical protein